LIVPRFVQVQHEFKPSRHHGAMGRWRNQHVLVRAVVLACVAGAPLVALGGMPPAQATSVSEPATKSGLTLDEAVDQVQNRTHGKVLRANKRQYGNMTEYLIKVLMPDGHVRVVPVRSRADRTPTKSHEESH
jgi:hypothetical protein